MIPLRIHRLEWLRSLRSLPLLICLTGLCGLLVPLWNEMARTTLYRDRVATMALRLFHPMPWTGVLWIWWCLRRDLAPERAADLILSPHGSGKLFWLKVTPPTASLLGALIAVSLVICVPPAMQERAMALEFQEIAGHSPPPLRLILASHMAPIINVAITVSVGAPLLLIIALILRRDERAPIWSVTLPSMALATLIAVADHLGRHLYVWLRFYFEAFAFHDGYLEITVRSLCGLGLAMLILIVAAVCAIPRFKRIYRLA